MCFIILYSETHVLPRCETIEKLPKSGKTLPFYITVLFSEISADKNIRTGLYSSRKLYSTEKRSDLPERAMKQISELYNFSRSIFSPYEAWDQSWDYGRLHALPLWPEFVCISRYGKNTKYTHYCPTVNAIEFPLEGNLNIALTGENITLSPGEFLILPAGEQNTLATSNSDFCRKISCGLCGPLAVPLLHQLKLDPGREFIIKDPETAFTMLKEINRLLFYKEKKASRIFAENVFIF